MCGAHTIGVGDASGQLAGAEVGDALHAILDEVLDLYVRDGLVYYAALKSERGPLDRYVASIAAPPSLWNRWSDPARAAFWLNAYNALVLRTVIDHYPIRGPSNRYPPNSIRQIPGAFETRRHRVAGEQLSLDDIETGKLAAFKDPRLYLALGRGAIGSGRLRSEAYRAGRLSDQLAAAAEEFLSTPAHVAIDRVGERLLVCPIFGWRETEFVAAYEGKTPLGPGRSPLERAILALLEPVLLPGEQSFIEQNRFRLEYHRFDWRLNDLTGGRRD